MIRHFFSSKPRNSRRSKSHLSTFRLVGIAVHHIIEDIRRRPLSFISVVLFTAILSATVSTLSIVLSQASLVFLRFAEHRIGDTDVIALPSTKRSRTNNAYVVRQPIIFKQLSSTSGLQGINFTTILDAFHNSVNECCASSRFAKAAPRWISSGYINSEEGRNQARPMKSYMLAFDTELEKESKIGRSWEKRRGGKLEGYMSSTMAMNLNVKGDQGMRSNFSMALNSLIQEMGIASVSNESAAVAEILVKTGMDLGLPINVSNEISDALVRSQGIKSGHYSSEILQDGHYASSVIKLSVDRKAGNLLIPKEVVNRSLSKYLSTGTHAFAEFTIIDTISSPKGKWPASFGNIIAIEANQLSFFMEEMVQTAFSSDTFKTIIAEDLYPFGALAEIIAKEIRERFLSLLRDLRIESSASIVGIQMNNRTSAYAEIRQTAKQSLAEFTDSIGKRIGADASTALITPLLTAFEEISFLRIFLYQFFVIIIVAVTGIGCFVVWTISSSEVRELMYTSATMRTLGFSRNLLSRFYLIVSLRHSLFGALFGTALTAAGLGITYEVLSKSFEVTHRDIRMAAVPIAILSGAIVPTIGSLIPSRRIIRRSIMPQDFSKDLNGEGLTIEVNRLKTVGCNMWVISASFLMTSYGAIFYFFLPRSFMEENYNLFFAVLNIAVAGLLLGLIIIFQVVQKTVQYIFLEVFLFIDKATNIPKSGITSERRLISLVMRRMNDHHRRNRSAALVLSMSTAIMLFCAAFTQLQADGLIHSVRESLGSDIVISAKETSKPLNETYFRILMSNLSSQGGVKRFSFITFPLSEKVQVRSVAEWPRSESLRVFGLDNEFFGTVYEDLTLFSETHARIKPSCLSKTGYSREPIEIDIFKLEHMQDQDLDGDNRSGKDSGCSEVESPLQSLDMPTVDYLRKTDFDNIPGLSGLPMPVIMSEAFREVLSVDTSTALQIKVKSVNLVAQALIMVQKLPSFLFSRLSSTASSSPILVSDRSFRRLSAVIETGWAFEEKTTLLEKIVQETSSPKQRLLIRLVSGSSQNVVRDQIRMVRSDEVDVMDMEENLVEVQRFKALLGTVFTGVAIMLSFLSASTLWFVFLQNAKDDTRTIALCRAIGLTDRQVWKMQLCEGFAVTLFGLCSGTAIGLLVSFALVLQDELFRGIRQTLRFPSLPYVVLSITSLFSAFMSSLLSWKELNGTHSASFLRFSTY